MTALSPDENDWTNHDAVAYIKNFMLIAKQYRLVDPENQYPDMEAVGYDIIQYTSKSSTRTLYEIIPQSAWTQPVYDNPGDINPDNGIAPGQFMPTKNGTVGFVVHFQYVPNY